MKSFDAETTSKSSLATIIPDQQDFDIYDAIKECEAALDTTPDNAELLFRYAYLLFLVNQTVKALNSLDRLFAVAPDFENAVWLRGGTLRRLRGDRDAETISLFSELAINFPDNPYIQCELGDILRANGKHKEARFIFERMQNPQFNEDEACRAEAALKMGIVCVVLGDTVEARKAFMSVPKSAPEHSDALEMLSLLD